MPMNGFCARAALANRRSALNDDTDGRVVNTYFLASHGTRR